MCKPLNNVALISACLGGGTAAAVEAPTANAQTTTAPASRPALAPTSTASPPAGLLGSLRGLWADDFDGPISTDRPDFTESTSVIPRGRFQLEGGYTFSLDRNVTDHTAPELLLRTGLWRGFELRTGWEGFSATRSVFRGETEAGRPRTFIDHDDGGTDMSLGFKTEVFRQEGWRPDFSLLGAVSLPTGAGGKSSGDADPEIKLLWGYELSESLSLTGNVNFALPTDEGGRFFQTAASLALGWSIHEHLGAYVEYYGFFPGGRNADCDHYLNGGLVFPITEHLQLDWRVGGGLNDSAGDFFTGVGFALRF